MSQFHGPNEEQVLRYTKNHLQSSLIEGVTSETLDNIVRTQLRKMGGVEGLGSQSLWLMYTSKDLLERVRQELTLFSITASP